MLSVRRAAQATDSFGGASNGKRIFAVQLEITNVGTTTLDDGPSLQASVIDSAGQEYDAASIDKIDAGPELPVNMNPPSGSATRGWLPFEVPRSAVIVTLKYQAGALGETGRVDLR